MKQRILEDLITYLKQNAAGGAGYWMDKIADRHVNHGSQFDMEQAIKSAPFQELFYECCFLPGRVRRRDLHERDASDHREDNPYAPRATLPCVRKLTNEHGRDCVQKSMISLISGVKAIRRTFRLTGFTPLLTLISLFDCAAANAAVKLPAIISDHMMVQANANPRIWGTADPLEKISASYLGKKVETQADASGNWQLFLGKIAPKTSFQLTIHGTNQVVIKDVLAGQVWLCAGQSNMALTLAEATGGLAEIATSTPPAVRFFTILERHLSDPAWKFRGSGKFLKNNNRRGGRAVGFFFAKKTIGSIE
ncbi:unnamed protein product [Sphagnum compactum]